MGRWGGGWQQSTSCRCLGSGGRVQSLHTRGCLAVHVAYAGPAAPCTPALAQNSLHPAAPPCADHKQLEALISRVVQIQHQHGQLSVACQGLQTELQRGENGLRDL